MKYYPIIILLCCFNYSYAQINFQKKEKNKIEISIGLDVTKRKSVKYFDNDTTQSIPVGDDAEFKRNHVAISLAIKKHIDHQLILKTEIRYKLWGFKESFKVPSNLNVIGYGFKTNVINLDASLNLSRRIQFFPKFELRPSIGFTVFYPLSASQDSNVYDGFNQINDNLHYTGKAFKSGYNIGSEFDYILLDRMSITLKALYYSPFNNTYNWQYGMRVEATQNPWRKWKIKNDGFYIGLGLNIALRKNYTF